MNRVRFLVVVGAAGALGLSAASMATPVVSSAAISGSTLTIAGSGFGLHANYGGSAGFLNVAWNNFESGRFDGGNMAINGASGSTSLNWRIVGSGNRPGSSYHIEKFNAGSTRGDYHGLRDSSGTTHAERYMTFWMKLLPNTQSGKFFRIWGSPQEDNIYLSTGGTDTMIRGFSESTSISPAPVTQWASPNSFGSDVWHRVEIYMANVPSSQFSVWMDGHLQFTKTNWVPTPWYLDGPWEVGGMIDWPDMWGGMNGAYCFDDLYMDYTRSRVEIGNASTWAASTVREVQISTAWSDGQVSARVNPGAFPSGSTVWVYVVDSAGNPSAGYAVVLPATPTTGGGTPAAPQNLRVVATP